MKVRYIPFGIAEAAEVTDKVSTVTITSAQLLALFTTAIEIVPAPPTGKTLFMKRCIVKYNYGTVVYTVGTATNLTVNYTDKNGTAVSATQAVTGMIDQASNQTRVMPALSTAFTPTASAKLVLSLAVANPTAGNGTLTVTTVYNIV